MEHIKGSIYTFGSHQHSGVGRIDIQMPIWTKFIFSFPSDIVGNDNRISLGLDVISPSRLILDFRENEVTCKAAGWTLPLMRRNGRVYIAWSVGVLYTTAELRQIHSHFCHPNPARLYAVMKRSDHDKVSAEGLSEHDRISATCDVCYREADAPHCFRISIPSHDY